MTASNNFVYNRMGTSLFVSASLDHVVGIKCQTRQKYFSDIDILVEFSNILLKYQQTYH